MTLLPSRKVTAAFIGVFLVGGLVGALAVLAFHDVRLSHFFTSTADPKSMADRIALKYVREDQLTPDEQARVAPLVQEMTQHLAQVRRQFGVDIIATLDDYHRRIGEQMSPDHRALFQKANAARKERMKAILQIDPTVPDAK